MKFVEVLALVLSATTVPIYLVALYQIKLQPNIHPSVLTMWSIGIVYGLFTGL